VKKTALVYVRTFTRGQKEERTLQAQIAWAKDATQTDGVKILPYGPRGDGWLKDDGVSGHAQPPGARRLRAARGYVFSRTSSHTAG
jgi:hypothetical protein